MACATDKLVQRGIGLVLRRDPEWHEETARANAGKRGAPYRYAWSLVASLAVIRSALGVGYRQLQGMSIASLGEGDAPSWSTIRRRIAGLRSDVICGYWMAACGPARSWPTGSSERPPGCGSSSA